MGIKGTEATKEAADVVAAKQAKYDVLAQSDLEWVAVRPGKTLVTRTPCAASSPRSASANPRSPNFDAA